MITVPLRITATLLVLVNRSNRFFLMVAIDVIDGRTGKIFAVKAGLSAEIRGFGPDVALPAAGC